MRYGLIVSSDVVNENTDCHQFAKQIEQAHATLEHKCQVACADSGYCDLEEFNMNGLILRRFTSFASRRWSFRSGT
jgi:hypothetical protein